MERDVELLFEVASMRYMPRVWRQFLDPPVANLAEHTFRVAWIALILAMREGADVQKVILMALLHDLPETRTGDGHYINAHYTVRHERRAMIDAITQTSIEQLMSVWEEFEARETLEAKIIKDADNLDVEIDTMELTASGHNLGTQLSEMREKAVYPKLFTESAKQLWRDIHAANPHDWHLNGPNRFNAGDWSKP